MARDPAEFLAAARQFEQDAEINLRDLGIALLLEFFAAPLLIFINYTPLLRRRIFDWKPQLAMIHAMMPEGGSVVDEALERIGRGIDRRRLIRQRIDRMAITIRLAVVLAYISILLAVILAPSTMMRFAMIGGWLIATVLAMLICVQDQHRRLRGGLRRDPG